MHEFYARMLLIIDPNNKKLNIENQQLVLDNNSQISGIDNEVIITSPSDDEPEEADDDLSLTEDFDDVELDARNIGQVISIKDGVAFIAGLAIYASENL